MLRLVKPNHGQSGLPAGNPTRQAELGFPPSDALSELAKAAVLGERAAVRTFLLSVGPQLLRVVRRVLGRNHPDVDDVAQESAFAVMAALAKYRGESSVMHFACRVAVLTAVNARRREAAQKRSAFRDRTLDVDFLESSELGPEASFAARVSARLVRALIDTLPIEQAEVLALHCVLGYTVPEIAETSRAPTETVRSRLRLAKNALRERVLSDPKLVNILEEFL